MKKLIALLLALIIAVGCFTMASAGSIFDTISNAGKTIVHGVKTVGNAVIDTVDYAISDKTAAEAYANTVNSASKALDNAVNTGKSVAQVGCDAFDFAVGTVECAAGCVSTAACALYESGEYLITGDTDFSATTKCAKLAKEGYQKADNDFLFEAAMVAGSAVGLPGYAVAGVNAAKTAVEYSVGYKTGDELKTSLINTGVSVVAAGASGVAGSFAGTATKTVVKAATGSAVSTTVKVVRDLNDKDNDRSVLDTILEDVTEGAMRTAISVAVAPAPAAGNTADAASDTASVSAYENVALDAGGEPIDMMNAL